MSTSAQQVVAKPAKDRRFRVWLAGFLVLGVLLGLVGPLAIAWQYHLDTDPKLIGLHFLALNVGYLLAVAIARPLVTRVSIRLIALIACLVAFASLISLSLLAPPVPASGRMVGLGFAGVASGGLITALLHVLESYFGEQVAGAVNRAGLLFGCGCLISTLTVAAIYFAGSVQIETACLALVPLIFFFLFARNHYPAAREPVYRRKEHAAQEMLRQVRSVGALLLSLLLFFQFGNEWAIAGWLPLFLIHRLGTNPVWAILALATYFLALMTFRLAAQTLSSRLNGRVLLMGSVVIAMIGYLLLSLSWNMTAAWIAVVVIAAGFAPIYPLVTENLDERFSYHPGFYNSLFTIAITGGMSAQWLLGYIDAFLGVKYVMTVPALGSIAVFVLASLILLETHIMGSRKNQQSVRSISAAAGKE